MAWTDYLNPLTDINAAGKGIMGAAHDMTQWGKNPIDPSQAQLQDSGYLRQFIQGQLGGVGGRQAPQVGGAQLNSSQQNQFRGQQQTLAQQLAAISGGQQMGAGEMATRRQFQQGLAAQLAQSQMARGYAAPSAARAAARNVGNMTVDASGQSAQAALQDQTQARGLLAQLLGQGREQDIGVAGQNAQLSQQADLANQAAKLQQMGMNDAAIASYLGQLYGVDAAEMGAKLGILQGNQQQQGYLGDLLQMGGTLGAAYLGRPGGGA